jgi:murein L,D-transpeptidase YafK
MDLSRPSSYAALAPSDPATAARVKVKIDALRKKVEAPLAKELEAKGLKLGSNLHLRIYKSENVMEAWLRADDGRYKLFKNYPICKFSGNLGPKRTEGDLQAPEGFYPVTAGLMHPLSNYNYAMNLGYPNDYDKAHNRTGSFTMIHGACESVGCYAMTNSGSEELFMMAHAAFENGQPKVDVHAFPFRMTAENVKAHSKVPKDVMNFWKNLQTGYAHFEKYRVPPEVSLDNKNNYAFTISADTPLPIKAVKTEKISRPPRQAEPTPALNN